MQYKIGFSKIRKLLHKFLKTGRIQLNKEEFVPFMYWGLFGKYPLYIGYDFARFVMDDLRDMDASRLPGLGITPEQLDVWLLHRSKKL